MTRRALQVTYTELFLREQGATHDLVLFTSVHLSEIEELKERPHA